MKRLHLWILMLLVAVTTQAAVTDTVEISTRHLSTPMNVIVITPDRIDQGQRFPTLYLLHGHGGNYTSWAERQKRLPALADLFGMVIVCPDGRNSWYWDSPKMHMESFFTEDLVPYIDENFPTVADSTMRAITGLSMGGHGGLWLAMRHPDIWKNAGSLSGGVDITKFPANWDMASLLGNYIDDPEKWKEHTVVTLARDLEPGRLNLIIDCGTEDFFYEVNENLHRILLDRKIPHDYITRPGAHNWDYWNNSILYQILYFSEAFRRAPGK